jgi:predicted nucleic acid-binding protein
VEIAFLDSSAVAKLFLPEIGSQWLRRFVRDKQIAISELVLYEVTVAMRRRYINAEITSIRANGVIDQVITASTTYTVYPLGGTTEQSEIRNLVFSLPDTAFVRTLDAIHLNAALKASEAAKSATPPAAFVFISADKQLIRTAQGEGLPTENPEDHP